ncbi:MAG: hypothetical protein H6772_03020 [Pseudomonadales bacterium]|nr:hypothetical protein [Pseudomonadales bacterium]
MFEKNKKFLNNSFVFIFSVILFTIFVFIFLYIFDAKQRLEFLSDSIYHQKIKIENAEQNLMNVVNRDLPLKEKDLAVIEAEAVLNREEEQYSQQIVDYNLYKSQFPVNLLDFN